MNLGKFNGIESEQSSAPSAFVEISGVKFYGADMGPVSREDAAAIEITPESVEHLIRHFHSIAPEIQVDFLSHISTENIQKLLQTAGSKFNEKMIDPIILMAFAKRKVEQQLVNGQQISWVESEPGVSYATIAFTVLSDEKKELGLDINDALGVSSVVAIDDSNRSLVTIEKRGSGQAVDDIPVNIIRGVAAPKSDSCVVVLKKQNEKVEYHTIFPGIISPPLPKFGQSSEANQYYTQWWQRHAFVKE